MDQITDAFDPPRRAAALVVLLPPAQSRLDDFHTHGFVAALRERQIPVDVMLAGIGAQQLMAGTSVSTLHEQVVLPARSAGYRQIWLAGISLGAFIALHYAAAHAAQLAGIALLAPYPGTGDVLAEIDAAGGPANWLKRQPPAGEGTDERTWWRWLCRESLARAPSATPVYFATGETDRFVRGQRMLAQLLPAEQVRYLPGEHDWPTWQKLWKAWLDDGPLGTLTCRVSARA